ncbi:hypothetical protein OF83DRAFT_1155049 [Amylostereum chailletii]|nr:hypothetical protein OF83DRAFT_1155049 [Amylostereum chailletii]
MQVLAIILSYLSLYDNVGPSFPRHVPPTCPPSRKSSIFNIQSSSTTTESPTAPAESV